jgi:hypothetical protein
VKAYVLTSGTVFALIAVVHVVRAVEEGAAVATSPVFLLTSALTVALSGWAWYVFRQLSRSQAP